MFFFLSQKLISFFFNSSHLEFFQLWFPILKYSVFIFFAIWNKCWISGIGNWKYEGNKEFRITCKPNFFPLIFEIVQLVPLPLHSLHWETSVLWYEHFKSWWNVVVKLLKFFVFFVIVGNLNILFNVVKFYNFTWYIKMLFCSWVFAFLKTSTLRLILLIWMKDGENEALKYWSITIFFSLMVF